MKYVIGKKHNLYGITDDKAVCEVLSEYTEVETGVEKLEVRVLYKRRDLLFEKYNDAEIEFSVRKKYFREIKDADSYVKRYNSKALKNVSNKNRILEIMNINREIPEPKLFEF